MALVIRRSAQRRLRLIHLKGFQFLKTLGFETFHARGLNSWKDPMLRDCDLDVLDRGLQDALKVLKETPLFEEAEESYKKALEEAAKLDVQLAKDDDVLRSMYEKTQNGVAFRIEKLKKQYQDGCSRSDATGAMSGIIANLRSRVPQPLVLLEKIVSELGNRGGS
ncbi:hypothetical protein Y032_0073g794 [Ancylostoma ceylanicum]|uniref:Uncharacterized protein n=1 Tax=Ancylostoma ceylanicum TaxID=53326 RepID=A0A016TWE4_9BILA|nr:hypothetical protein Y032_0073g794 [Ancylostoma ceylanicum]